MMMRHRLDDDRITLNVDAPIWKFERALVNFDDGTGLVFCYIPLTENRSVAVMALTGRSTSL